MKGSIFGRGFGALMIGVALYIFLGLAGDLREYKTQQEWPQTTATVTYVRDYHVNVGTQRTWRHATRPVCDVAYTYEVGGAQYTGQFFKSGTPYLLHQEISVRYDPAAPGNSTPRQQLSYWDVGYPALYVAGFLLCGIRLLLWP